MAELMELREKQQQKISEARQLLDQITDDVSEDRAKELETQYDAYMAEVDDLEAKAERARKLEEAESRLSESRPPQGGGSRKGDDSEKRSYRDMFSAYLRGGRDALTDEEQREIRAQETSTDTKGGHTVPTEFFDELIESMKAYGPMLNPGVTRQITTSTGAKLEWPTMDDTSNKGSRLGENTQDSTSELTFGQKELDAYKYTSGIFQVSEELLQDSALDVEQIVRDAMAERIGRIVNEELTTADGSSKPQGIIPAATVGTTANATGSIDPDEIFDFVHTVDPAYRSMSNVAFMFNDNTLKALRKLKDGDGNYIWQAPDIRTGAPGTLLDFPYAINQDMDDIGTSNKPLVFGAMNRYVVRRVREFAVRRLVERYADFYQVGFVGFGRFDGELLDSSAVKTFQMAAS